MPFGNRLIWRRKALKFAALSTGLATAGAIIGAPASYQFRMQTSLPPPRTLHTASPFNTTKPKVCHDCKYWKYR